MSLSEQIKKKEMETKDRLELLSMLLFEDLLGESDLYDIGSYQLIITWGDVINIVEASGAQVDIDKLDSVIKQALSDYEAEVYDLQADPEGAQERINLTVWFTTWGTYDEAVLDTARRAGYEFIEWNTQQDERVCPVCLENEGIHPIDSAPTMPAHPACRCWWSLPAGHDSLDSLRQSLDAMHSQYMKKISAIRG